MEKVNFNTLKDSELTMIWKGNEQVRKKVEEFFVERLKTQILYEIEPLNEIIKCTSVDHSHNNITVHFINELTSDRLMSALLWLQDIRVFFNKEVFLLVKELAELGKFSFVAALVGTKLEELYPLNLSNEYLLEQFITHLDLEQLFGYEDDLYMVDYKLFKDSYGKEVF